MSWLSLILAVPAGFLLFALIHDFFAGLSDERVWGEFGPEERI